MHGFSHARQERLAHGAAALGLLARQDLATAEVVAAVLEAPQLFELMQGLMQQVPLLAHTNLGYSAKRTSRQRKIMALAIDKARVQVRSTEQRRTVRKECTD